MIHDLQSYFIHGFVIVAKQRKVKICFDALMRAALCHMSEHRAPTMGVIL